MRPPGQPFDEKQIGLECAYPWPLMRETSPKRPSRIARLSATLIVLGLLAPLALRAADAAPGVSVSEATAEQKKQALTLYEEGGKLFQAKKYNEALSAFTASYEIVRSPNAHLMLARSLIELGRFPAAAQELAGAEVEASSDARYAATLEKVKALKIELAPRIATLRVDVTGHAQPERLVLVVAGNSGAPACKIGAPCTVTAESLKVSVLEGAETKATQEVTLIGGAEKAIAFDLTPPPPVLPPPVLPPPVRQPKSSPDDSLAYFIAGGVVGVVGLGGIAAGGALYALAQSDLDELAETCDANKVCPASAQEIIDGGRSKQTWSIVAFIAGGATTSLGVGLLIAGGTKRGGSSPSSTAQAGTTLLVGPTFLGVKTSF